MKGHVLALALCLIPLLLSQTGCIVSPNNPPEPTEPNSNELWVYTGYMANGIDIMPLTDFVPAQSAEQQSMIEIYVGLLDRFGSQIKAPGVFRFELYEYIRRSAEPKGKRITIWSDIDLTAPNDNNFYWQDYLRAYRFNLEFEPEQNTGYVLQVTCMCPSGKRLSADFVLKVNP